MTPLEAHLEADPAARAEWNRTQKLKSDSRITRFDRVLRKTSMDELPQLWNVLKGEMSLVGPRPMMPDQRAFYPDDALPPGHHRPWQVSSRYDSSFADSADFDNRYDRDLLLRTDLGLLVTTVGVVLNETGY